MSQIAIDRVVSVSLSQNLQGLANANTSALALLTTDVPISPSYGAFGIYYGPAQVAADWGSNSSAYRIAENVFSQAPSILSAGGFLVIIPRNPSAPASAATLLGAGPVDLTQLTATDYKINEGTSSSTETDLAIGALNLTSLATAQASLNSTAVTAAGLVFSLSGSLTAAFITLKTTATGATAHLNIGTTASGTDIAPLLGLSGSAVGVASGTESLKDCILRTYQATWYFGIVADVIPTDAELPGLAAIVQSLDKILFYGEHDTAKVNGIMATLTGSGYTNTRGLLYTTSDNDAMDFAAAYASRALSVDFTGDATVITMHLKTLTGFTGDPGLTETIVTAAQNAGVDVYVNFGTAAGSVFTSGANEFFDQVYVGLALKFAIKVAGFNFLSGTSTKIPQTEIGMNGLKAAYRKVMKAFVTNGAFAPGAWNGTTFGDPEDFIRNIGDVGFYIFSSPIANQSQAVRATRAAPLVQIAAKSAGAIHSSNVQVFIEA
jgi:hypothetical protein